MRTIYDGYTQIKTDKPTFFAGANTAEGFAGEYHSIADEKKLERVYIIKGGPGTGKSTMMRKCAELAEKNGLPGVRYLCGSDPDSLDCVVLDGRIAVLDGTAPHIRDMIYPGASSELLDLSSFWDSCVLEQERDAVVSAASRKSEYYSAAYEYLSAAELIERDKRQLSEKVFLKEKAAAYIGRLMKKLGKPKNPKGKITYVRTHGLTMKGAYALDSLHAEYRYTVADCYGCAPLFMKLVLDKLKGAGYSLTVSKLPVPDSVVSILIEDCGVLITASGHGSGEKSVNLSRFADDSACAEIRGEFRLASKLQSSCMDEALDRLAKAAEEHFALEEIYIRAMDFDALGAYTGKLLKGIEKRLLRK